MPHIDIERLRAVATSEGMKFTEEECEHLGICPDCFLGWSEFVAEAEGISTEIEDSQSDPEIK